MDESRYTNSTDGENARDEQRRPHAVQDRQRWPTLVGGIFCIVAILAGGGIVVWRTAGLGVVGDHAGAQPTRRRKSGSHASCGKPFS